MIIASVQNLFSMIQNSSTNVQPNDADYWWLAFAPLVVTIIIFYIVRWGFLRFLHGDRFIAKLFGISEEEQRAKMIEFKNISLERLAEKEKKAKMTN